MRRGLYRLNSTVLSCHLNALNCISSRRSAAWCKKKFFSWHLHIHCYNYMNFTTTLYVYVCALHIR